MPSAKAFAGLQVFRVGNAEPPIENKELFSCRTTSSSPLNRFQKAIPTKWRTKFLTRFWTPSSSKIPAHAWQPLHRERGLLQQTLARHAEQGRRMPVELAAFVASRVCRGREYAHTRTDAQGVPLGKRDFMGRLNLKM